MLFAVYQIITKSNTCLCMFSDIMRKSAYADYIYQTHQSEYQLVRLTDVIKIINVIYPLVGHTL